MIFEQRNIIVGKYIFLIICFFSLKAFSQDSTQTKRLRHQISLTGYGTSGKIPFWMRANQYSTVPVGTGLSVDMRSEAEKNLKRQEWKVGYGVGVVGNLSSSNQFLLPEMYGKLQYKKWELYIGRRQETFGFADTTLGTGSFSWSGNSLPIPKIQLGIVDYIPLKFTKNLLAFKGTFAHGWFGTSQYAFGYMLHQKTLYLRLAKASWPIALYGGFVHNVQWGGRTFIDLTTVKKQHLPSSFKDYLYVVSGLGGAFGGANSAANPFDSTNRVGNHIGTLDVGIEWRLPKQTLTFYRQSIFEDGSLYYLNSIKDGLHGIMFTNLYPKRDKRSVSLQKATFEFLYTLSQGGPIFGPTNFTRGNDNYFNHQQYFDGWSYRGKIIGTPFITKKEDTKLPYIANIYEIAANNRVRVYHWGLQGYIGTNITFTTKLSWSHNYGNYNFPYPKAVKQFSGLIGLAGNLTQDNFKWNAALAWDRGGLYSNHVGARLGIQMAF